MISKEELERGIARTQADMNLALADDSVRDEVEAVTARYAALEMLESLFKTASGSKKLSRFRDNYHRDFIVSVSLAEDDEMPVSCSSRELAFA